ncbi:MAG: hypothetical protein C5B52_06185 [Bacteroidetes bacterium]|nr:MAG: hypothetical protein C5B52_06185 [Bacteroidota bacterium]
MLIQKGNGTEILDEKKETDKSDRKHWGNYSGLNEYKIVAFPNMKISGKITSLQKGIMGANNFEKKNMPSPGICVMKFFALDIIEEVLIKWVQRICSLHEEFSVTLNNIGASPSGVIYLRVLNPTPFQQISSKMNAVEELIISSGGRLTMKVKNPKIIISEDLPEDDFFNTMLELSRKSFHESFRLQELWLMKKSASETEDHLINIFRLLPNAL